MVSNRIKNIYYMLAYAYGNLNEGEHSSIELEEFHNVHDLLSTILLKGVSKQIKQGLYRCYIPYTETLSSLRGKIEVSHSIKEQTMMTRKMVCQYDIFSEDTLLNQIIKSTMMLLLKYGDVKTDVKKNLRKILIYFHGVTDINPISINWSGVSYHRNNATYKTLINICYLVIKGLLLTTEDGKYKMAQYLDDLRMYRLYEKFVLGYYKKEYPEFGAKASYIDWDIGENDSKVFLPAMKSDVTLTYGLKTLIIDTKYLGKNMQYNTMYNKTTLISQNLYQIYTYVKNKDKDKTGNVSGVLLYAKTDEDITPNEDFLMGGNPISVKTLDLSGEWQNIKEQLDSLVSGLI